VSNDVNPVGSTDIPTNWGTPPAGCGITCGPSGTAMVGVAVGIALGAGEGPVVGVAVGVALGAGDGEIVGVAVGVALGTTGEGVG